MPEIPTLPTLNGFLAFTRTNALARVSRYAVMFQAAPGLVTSADEWDVSMLCEEASIPGKQIMHRSLRINALSEPRAHTMDFWNDTASFQFLIDNDWTPRKFFEDWLTLCVGTGVTREVGDYDQYVTDVMIHALAPTAPADMDISDTGTNFSDPEHVLWSVRLVEAWPRSIVIAPLSYSNPGFHRMLVTFMYKRWESLDQYDENREDSAVGTTPTHIVDQLQGGTLGSETATELKKGGLLQSLSKAKNAINKGLKVVDKTLQEVNHETTKVKNVIDQGITTKVRVQDRFTIIKKKIVPFTGS